MLMSQIRNFQIIHNIRLCHGFKTCLLLITQTPMTHLLSATTLSIFGLVAQRAAAAEGGTYFCLLQFLRPPLSPLTDTFGNTNNTCTLDEKHGHLLDFLDQS